MKYCCLFILLASIVSCTIENPNPFMSGFNEFPDFRNLEPRHMIEARQTAERNLASMLEQYKSIPDAARTFENTLTALDDMHDQIDRIQSPIEFMQVVHPDDAV